MKRVITTAIALIILLPVFSNAQRGRGAPPQPARQASPIDIDTGSQTRRFYFKPSEPSAGEPTWQGSSVAQWEIGGGRDDIPRGGDLKVVTTHMKPGYLQKNGPPYSANAVVTEYFHTTKEPNGDQWLILETLVDDQAYLAASPTGTPGDDFGPFIRSTSFKKQTDATGWNPTPCSAR